MIVIALMGPAGSGKSTIAQFLVERYGAKRYAFAGPLKEVARRTLDFTPEQVYGTQEQKEAADARYGFSPRWFLQRLGTEGARVVFGDDFWTRTALDQIRRDALLADAVARPGAPSIAVIEDARFANEAAAVRALAAPLRGLVWRLDPPADSPAPDAATAQHASEIGWREAPHDAVIAPPQRGLVTLCAIVSREMDALLHPPGDAPADRDARIEVARSLSGAEALRGSVCTGYYDGDRCSPTNGCKRPGCPIWRNTVPAPAVPSSVCEHDRPCGSKPGGGCS